MLKWGLGTAQLGSRYGISNAQGQPSRQEAVHILDTALSRGISLLDTSPIYGESQRILGEWLPQKPLLRVITKTASLHSIQRLTVTECDHVEKAFLESLTALRQTSVYGFLIHEPDLLGLPGADLLIARLQRLKQQHHIDKIGISVYTAAQIDLACKHFVPDIVQVPMNILDQRLIRSGHLSRLKAKGVEIHARSIFLQGLLFMSPNQMAPYFAGFQALFERYHLALKAHGISSLQMAIQFIRSRPEIDCALVGVESATQLIEILDAAETPCVNADFTALSCDDEKLLNPSLWKTQ